MWRTLTPWSTSSVTGRRYSAFSATLTTHRGRRYAHFVNVHIYTRIKVEGTYSWLEAEQGFKPSTAPLAHSFANILMGRKAEEPWNPVSQTHKDPWIGLPLSSLRVPSTGSMTPPQDKPSESKALGSLCKAVL